MFNLFAVPITGVTSDSSLQSIGRPAINVTPDSSLQSIERTTGAVLDIMQWMGYLLSAGLFILAIIFLIKSIVDSKKVNEEISEKTINSVKTTSIVLLVINILAVCSNFVMAIMAIISTVFAVKAKKLFFTDIELARSKAKTASVLNIIISALMILGPIITVFSVTLLNVVWSAAGM